jgi:hypothetical protein
VSATGLTSCAATLKAYARRLPAESKARAASWKSSWRRRALASRSKIDAVRKDLDGEKQFLAEIKVSIGSLKVWPLRLYIGRAASLLLVMAHGFKWL